jgi:hypothetical protein
VANYCVLADCVDSALSIELRHVEAGNMYVDVALRTIGINPADVVLPQALLTAIGSTYAKREACIDGAIGEQSVLIDKAKQFKQTLDMLIGQLSKDALGIVTAPDDTAGSYAVIKLGRA